MNKLQALWAKVQPILAKLYSASPLAVGIAAGYFGHGLIKLAIDTVVNTVKLVFKI